MIEKEAKLLKLAQSYPFLALIVEGKREKSDFAIQDMQDFNNENTANNTLRRIFDALAIYFDGCESWPNTAKSLVAILYTEE